MVTTLIGAAIMRSCAFSGRDIDSHVRCRIWSAEVGPIRMVRQDSCLASGPPVLVLVVSACLPK
jgi:hypothetical protein